MLSPEERALVARHLADDPTRLALQLRRQAGARAAVVATQVALLQRARHKLPTWAAARCELERTALEQASSEAAAALRFAGLQGERAIDLTWGLGVDSWQLARQYRAVLYVEPQPERIELARQNFETLGVLPRMQLLLHTAESALTTLPEADLIYLDPDRRADGGRRIRLEAMQPDVLQLMPHLLALAPRVCVKLSPMLDAQELARRLPQACRIEALGLQGECKELLAWVQREPASPHQWLARGPGWQVAKGQPQPKLVPVAEPAVGKPDTWVYEADPAVYKMDLLAEAAQQYLNEYRLTGPRGYALSDTDAPAWPGRRWRLAGTLPAAQHALKKMLTAAGITAAFISGREYPEKPELLRKRLKLKESSKLGLLFTPGAVYHVETG